MKVLLHYDGQIGPHPWVLLVSIFSPIHYISFGNYFSYLGFVSPCIIIHSSKSTHQMHQSLRFNGRRLNTAQRVSGVLIQNSISWQQVNRRRLLQFISSWWWAWGCPKHVKLYLNDEQQIW